jgi:hypothetical protein
MVEPVPAIEMEKTVGLDPMVCATTEAIEVPAGSEVTFCFQVFNTGNVPLSTHDLEDTELGVILNDYDEPLLPGNSFAILTETVVYITTTNHAIWTAYNPGPSDIVTATDSATVSAIPVPVIETNPSSLESSQGSDVQVTLPLSISNLGVVDLYWSFYGESSFSPTTIELELPLIFPPVSAYAEAIYPPKFEGPPFDAGNILDQVTKE